MEEHLHEIKADVKEIKADITEIKVSVAKNTASLDYHIKRTDILEDSVKTRDKWMLGLLGSGLITLLGILLKALVD